MKLFHTHHHLVGGTLLIAGTSIGVGMLALPVATAAGGFFPSLLIYVICWLFMVAIARLILEACTWMPKDANLITIMHKLLGKKGAVACWIVYLFLFYCLMTAHVAAGGDAVFQLSASTLPKWLSILIYVAVFAPVVYLGTRAVDRLNIGLMIGVVLTYLLFLATTFSHIDYSHFTHHNWVKIWPALPIILTAFGFQNLIPTLYSYMDGDHKKICKAIWFGTLIPLCLYIVWEFVVLGVVPKEQMNAALAAGESAIPALEKALNSSALARIAQGFAFFAMTTSFVGIAIAFFDFWADGLKWAKKGMHRVGLVSLVFLVPLIAVFSDPMIFISALNLAGGVGMILLFGIFPVLFVWSGRYFHGHSLQHQFIPGGKASLTFMMLFSLAVLFSQFLF